MKQSIDKVYEVRQQMTSLVDNLIKVFSTDEVISELMYLRGYDKSYYREDIYNMFKEVGVFRLDYFSEILLVDSDITIDKGKTLGILDSKGDYLLQGRFAIPIRDINHQVTALVGWYPDVKKYITTPTYGFSKDGQFFNIECYEKALTGDYEKYVSENGEIYEYSKGVVYLVEGIFDTLTLRALGLPALGNMGLDMSLVKTEILTRFGKVIAIPDNDKAGRRTNRYVSHLSSKRGTNSAWKIKNDHVIVQLPRGVKDVDDLIKGYICKEDLLRCQIGKYKLSLYEE